MYVRRFAQPFFHDHILALVHYTMKVDHDSCTQFFAVDMQEKQKRLVCITVCIAGLKSLQCMQEGGSQPHLSTSTPRRVRMEGIDFRPSPEHDPLCPLPVEVGQEHGGGGDHGIETPYRLSSYQR